MLMAYDFDKIATNYDRLNHLMTAGMDRRWRRRAVNQAVGTDGTPLNVLDVACGTGDLSIEFLRHRCHVTGIDLSSEMLTIAKAKTAEAGFQPDAFNYLLADAEQLPFDDNTFDIVSCAFGIRNFIHLEQGLREMARVLKPQGRLLIMELSTPDCALVRPFYNLYTRRIVPWLGAGIAGNREAYTYLPSSVEKFPKGEAMLQILNSVGLPAKQTKFFFAVCRLYHSQPQLQPPTPPSVSKTNPADPYPKGTPNRNTKPQ